MRCWCTKASLSWAGKFDIDLPNGAGTAHNIMKWNGTAWSTLGSVLPARRVR